MEKTLEQNLLFEAIKSIQERKTQQEEYITTNLLDRDEYAQRVGMIRACNEIEEDFKRIHNTFFPST